MSRVCACVCMHAHVCVSLLLEHPSHWRRSLDSASSLTFPSLNSLFFLTSSTPPQTLIKAFLSSQKLMVTKSLIRVWCTIYKQAYFSLRIFPGFL